MDNINIKFLGYSADGSFKRAYKKRENPMSLETFFSAVNQATVGGCSCCKQDVIVFAVQPVGIPQIKPTALSLCVECLRSLPVELEVINIDCNGAPPLLIDKIYGDSEV